MLIRSLTHNAALLIASLMGTGIAYAADPATSATEPANLSRLLGGAKIQLLNPSTGEIVPQAGITAIIDDDVSSGWTPNVGKSLVLVSLPQNADLSSLALFAPGAEGSYKVHVVSSPDEALKSIGGKPDFSGNISDGSATGKGSAQGQFLVIELDLTATAPIRSFDAIGVPKPGGDNFVSVVSPVSGEQNSGSNKDGEIVEVNFAAEALGAKVSDKADPGLNAVIDGDTSTSGSIVINAEQKEQSLIDLAAAVEVKHVSLSFAEAKGKVTFLATDPDNPKGRVIGEATLDGTAKTLTIDVPGISAQGISIVWESSDGSPLVVGELGVFALARVRRERVADDSSSRFRLDIQSDNTPVGRPSPPIDYQPPVPPVIIPPPTPVSA